MSGGLQQLNHHPPRVVDQRLPEPLYDNDYTALALHGQLRPKQHRDTRMGEHRDMREFAEPHRPTVFDNRSMEWDAFGDRSGGDDLYHGPSENQW